MARVSLDRREGRSLSVVVFLAHSLVPTLKDRVSVLQIRIDDVHWPLDRLTAETAFCTVHPHSAKKDEGVYHK